MYGNNSTDDGSGNNGGVAVHAPFGEEVVEEYGDEEEEEEEEDLGPYVRKVGWALSALAFSQIWLSFGMLFLADNKRYRQDKLETEEIFCGCVGVICGVVGIVAGLARIELMSRTYFVFQLWLLSTATNYLYFTVEGQSRFSMLCDPQLSYVDGTADAVRSYECASGVAANYAKISLAVVFLLVSLGACLCTFEFEDALDDYSDQQKSLRLAEQADCDDGEEGEVAEGTSEDDGRPPKDDVHEAPVDLEYSDHGGDNGGVVSGNGGTAGGPAMGRVGEPHTSTLVSTLTGVEDEEEERAAAKPSKDDPVDN